MKSYVVGTHLKCLTEVILMSNPNIHFYDDKRKISVVFLRGVGGGVAGVYGLVVMSCILSQLGWGGRGFQLILASCWASPAILEGECFYFLFLLFLHFHSCSSVV